MGTTTSHSSWKRLYNPPLTTVIELDMKDELLQHSSGGNVGGDNHQPGGEYGNEDTDITTYETWQK